MYTFAGQDGQVGRLTENGMREEEDMATPLVMLFVYLLGGRGSTAELRARDCEEDSAEDRRT
jgi:hypothetical protein